MEQILRDRPFQLKAPEQILRSPGKIKMQKIVNNNDSVISLNISM